MKYPLLVLLLFIHFAVKAQYWFGPKVGFHRAAFEYDEATYKTDSFNVNSSYGFQLGGVFIYEATKMYSVQTEITYKRVTKSITSRLTSPIITNNTFNYLSVPFLLRVSFGKEPVHYFIGGGPELNIWLGGKGDIKLDEFSEGPVGVLDEEDNLYKRNYDFVFRQSKSSTDKWVVQSANRVQYTLTAVAGVYLDLRTNGRLLFEGKYMWGHSNFGFNNNPDFIWDSYYENFENRINMATISVTYLFQYDSKVAKKGMSTIPASNRKEIKVEKKDKKNG